VLLLPGVVRPQESENEKSQQVRQAVFEVTGQAVEQLKKCGAQKANRSAQDLKQQCDG